MTDQSVIIIDPGSHGPQRHPSLQSRPRARGRRRPARRARASAAPSAASAILAAALEEFSARGFAAARLDDVARRAGVAKGTIYLYFADKETLFQELMRSELSPVVGALEHVSHADMPIRAVAEQLIELFVREIFETRRKDVIRLVITEGPRFPKLAEFYYREVHRARDGGGPRACCGARSSAASSRTTRSCAFRSLLAAPGMVAIIWSGLFDRFEPLDVRAMMRAHFDILFGDGSAA